MAPNADHIKWFRGSSPYIQAHRGKTFVICLSSDALQSGNLPNLVSDLALLNALGVRLVLVFGGEGRVEKALAGRGLAWESHGRRRITGPDVMTVVAAVLGEITAELTARFAASTPDAPARSAITLASGNYLKAKPSGIVGGVDLQLTGEVRSIDPQAISHHLDGGALVLIPAMGHSPSGETFYLEADRVARETACALAADKLIYLTADAGVMNPAGELINEIDLSLPVADEHLAARTRQLLAHCDAACRRGVARCHLVSFELDGAIPEELFTRDGCGTQIVGHSYEQIRAANVEDVPGIIKLIAPLEAAGVLVKRSRELLESEVDKFIVIERDGLLISCAALYPFDTAGELACLVTHPDYRKSDRGDRLLAAIEKSAKGSNLAELFVLTTQSAHWFLERGFEQSCLDRLPGEKKACYNYQRNASVLTKKLA